MRDWTVRMRFGASHNDVTARDADGKEINFDLNSMKTPERRQLENGVILGFFGDKGMKAMKKQRYRDWKSKQAVAS